jgi:hypothetical protein
MSPAKRVGSGRRLWAATAALATAALATAGGAQAVAADTADNAFVPGLPPSPSVNDWGQYGLIEDPNARLGRDGDFHFNYTHVSPYDRYGIDATVLPWFEFGFHYTSINDRAYSTSTAFSGNQKYKDRSVAVKVRLVEEGALWPDIAVGATDIAGTGLFESQYLVASRRYYNIDFTAGIGWGLMGSQGNIPNPLGFISSHFKRPVTTAGSTPGGYSFSNYFGGPRASLFGGLEYQSPIKGLRLKLEYDADNYQEEPLGNVFKDRSPVNIGVEYSPWNIMTVSAGFERGTTAMFRIAFHENFNTLRGLPVLGNDAPPLPDTPPPPPPKGQPLPPTGRFATYLPPDQTMTAPTPGGAASSPIPSGDAVPDTAATSGAEQPVRSLFDPALFPQAAAPEAPIAPILSRAERHAIAKAVFKDLKAQKLTGERFAIRGQTAYLRFSNDSYRLSAMAIGRAARVVARDVPPGIEAINLQVTEGGLMVASVTLLRQDVVDAANGHGSPDEVWEHTVISHVAPEVRAEWDVNPKAYPRFTWGLSPRLRQQVGGPNGFFLFQIYAGLNAEYTLRPGLSVSGLLAQNIYNDFNQLTLTSNSTLPHVRSDIAEYLHHGSSGIFQLHGDYLFSVANDWYGRISGGILEEMYSGVDGEVLYRPAGQRWAVGLDLNHVYKRDFDELFGNQDYNITTGHLTFYYKLPWLGALAQLHVGQYLAGDRGATFEISRRFDSGVTIGAFATKTNVSAAQFGEGSFDKGFYISFPLDLGLGTRTKDQAGFTYRPLTRDGGQMVDIPKELYGVTDGDSPEEIDRSWNSLLK